MARSLKRLHHIQHHLVSPKKTTFSQLSFAKTHSQSQQTYLVTGGQGFIGAWIVRQLVRDNQNVVVFDLKRNDTILEQILTKQQLSDLTRCYGNVSDFETVLDLMKTYKPTYVIHLAGLQIPTCRAVPQVGVVVNVAGTVNVFEAGRQVGSVKSVVYASSAAVCGPPDDYKSGPVRDDARHLPRTHYGVFKQANEGNARIFWQDHNIPSVGLRPLTVFGVGREVGLTSDPTKCMKAAVAEAPSFKVRFGGATVWNWSPDLADVFIRCAEAAVKKPGAYACNIKGESLSIPDFVQIISEELPNKKAAAEVAVAKGAIILPFPDEFDETTLADLLGGPPKVTPIRSAIRQTIQHFQELKDQGRLHTRDLVE